MDSMLKIGRIRILNTTLRLHTNIKSEKWCEKGKESETKKSVLVKGRRGIA